MAKQDKKKKIALVGYKLAKGGLERVLSSVSHLLYDADCDVHVIVLDFIISDFDFRRFFKTQWMFSLGEMRKKSLGIRLPLLRQST